MTEEEREARLLEMVHRFAKEMDENPPPPPSAEALALTRRLIAKPA